MFEGRWWADLDVLSGEPMPSCEEPERSDEDYLAEVEWLIAQDPHNRPEPTAAEVIARGESEAMNPGLIGQLWQLDPHVLEEDQRIGYAVAMDRVANAAHARRSLGVAAVIDVSPDDVEVPREMHASAQLGAALGLGSGAASALVSDAIQLRVLPGVRAAALAGDLPWRKACSFTGNTVGLDAEQVAAVEAKLLAKSWGSPPSKLDAAVRRAAEEVDPGRSERNKKDRDRDIRLVTSHYGNGLGEVLLTLPSEKVDMCGAAADRWARARKADGDPRSIDELRAEFFYVWSCSYLTHADAGYCDRVCNRENRQPADTDTDAAPADTGTEAAPADTEAQPADTAVVPVVESSWSSPTSHGRRAVQRVVWDLTSLLGLTDHCGLLLDSETPIAASTVTEMIAAGLRIRRGIIDGNGWITDLTRKAWNRPPTDGSPHPKPVELLLTTTGRLDELGDDITTAITELGDRDPHLAALLRELLDAARSADDLDAHPDDETPSAALAAYTNMRAGHPINPCAGPSPATAADLEHHQARSDGGKTERANLGPVVRRWHRLKTFDGWTVTQTPEGWLWTSPTGRKYLIEPFDYRLGP